MSQTSNVAFTSSSVTAGAPGPGQLVTGASTIGSSSSGPTKRPEESSPTEAAARHTRRRMSASDGSSTGVQGLHSPPLVTPYGGPYPPVGLVERPGPSFTSHGAVPSLPTRGEHTSVYPALAARAASAVAALVPARPLVGPAAQMNVLAAGPPARPATGLVPAAPMNADEPTKRDMRTWAPEVVEVSFGEGPQRRTYTFELYGNNESNPQLTIGLLAGRGQPEVPFIALSAIRGVGRTAHRHVITRIMTRLASVRRTLDQTFNLIIRLPPIETQDAVFQGQSVDWSMEDAATGTRRAYPISEVSFKLRLQPGDSSSFSDKLGSAGHSARWGDA